MATSTPLVPRSLKEALSERRVVVPWPSAAPACVQSCCCRDRLQPPCRRSSQAHCCNVLTKLSRPLPPTTMLSPPRSCVWRLLRIPLETEFHCEWFNLALDCVINFILVSVAWSLSCLGLEPPAACCLLRAYAVSSSVTLDGIVYLHCKPIG